MTKGHLTYSGGYVLFTQARKKISAVNKDQITILTRIIRGVFFQNFSLKTAAGSDY